MTTNRPGLPAWKRLGLKLKYASEVPERIYANGSSAPAVETAPVTSGNPQLTASEPLKKKRKIECKSERKERSTLPLPTNANGTAQHSGRSLKKQVSFSSDTKFAAPTADDDIAPVETTSEGSHSKKPKRKSEKKSQQPPARKSNASIDYLDQYHSDWSSWKFNKNRETWILKHVFSENDIPPDHNLAIAEYIHGLQGTGARERLKTQCLDSLRKAKETESESGRNKDSSTRSDKYIQRLRDDLDKPATSSQAGSQKDGEDDQKYKDWIRRQSRPTLLLWALGLDEQLVSNGTETKSSTGLNGVDAATKAKKGRGRKTRTTVVDYESSSSSSGSSSDSESEEDKGDKKMSNGTAVVAVEEDTSSSGSEAETSSSDSESSSGPEDS